MKRLFLNDVRRGLGKAYIELTNSKDKMEYLDTLIFACTHDCTNDFIFEGPKGEYLYQMIQLYDLEIQNRIMYIIIDSLNINDSRSQIFQKLDLLMCYIDDNLDIIQNALNDFYISFITETKKWTKNKLLSFEIISIIMDRAFGKKKTKEVLNFIIKEDLDKDSFGWYFSILEDKYKKDKSIQEIVKHEEIEIIKREYTFDELLASNNKAFIRGFGFNANDEELKKVTNYLFETQDINQIKKILNVYTANEKVDIKYKLPIELCFKLLKKYEGLIEKEVYDVLKYYKSDEVLNLGLKLIEDKDFLYYGLVMLFTNYSPKYRELIIEAYKKIDFSFKSYNEITSDTIWFMNHKRKNYPDEILLINFYKSYDSFMRECIYDVMKKRNLLTTRIIEECKYDFNYEISEKSINNSD